MNWDTLENEWINVKDKVKERWDKLTHEDLDNIKGKKDKLVEKINEYYGITIEEAEKQLQSFLDLFTTDKKKEIQPDEKNCDCSNVDKLK